jgi:hypothetical protein
VVETTTGLPAPHSFGDVVHHGGDLLYNSDRATLQRYDLATSSLGSPEASANKWIMTTQPVGEVVHFWGHCGCGGSPDVWRHDFASTFDTIHTGDDLGRQISVRAGEWIQSTGTLWLHGKESATSVGRFLLIDSNAEPDVLLDTRYFNRTVNALAFDGTDLWAIVTVASRSVCRLDMTTGRVIESFEVPDETVTWTGLDFDANGMMYLVGQDEVTEMGVIVGINTTVAVPERSEPVATAVRP